VFIEFEAIRATSERITVFVFKFIECFAAGAWAGSNRGHENGLKFADAHDFLPLDIFFLA